MPNTQSKNPIGIVFGWFLYVCAAVFMPFWETGKYLTKKTYHGSFIRGIFVSLAGLPATVYGAIYAANFVLEHHYSWPVWSLAGAVSGAIVGGIVWPALYLVVFKPVWDLVDQIFKLNRKVAENVVQPLSSSLIGLVRHLPLSENLWQAAESKKTGRQWGMKALSFVLGLGALAVGLVALYFSYFALLGLLPVFGPLPVFTGVFLSQVVAATLALTALVLASGFLFQYIEYGSDKSGRESFTAVAYSAILTYLAITKLSFIAALALTVKVPVGVAVFVLALGYVLPVVISILQGGLMEAFLKGWGKLLDAAYDSEEDKDYALFFAQFANICVALFEGLVAFIVAGAIHLPVVLVYAVTAIVTLYSYAANPRDVTGTRRVTPVFGVSAAIASGLAAYWFAPSAVLTHDFYHYAFGFGVVAFVGLIFYPFAYLALRFVVKPVSAGLGQALLAVSSRAVAAYKVVGDRLRRLQRTAFGDSSAYADMFGHLFILTVIVLGVIHGAPGAYWTALSHVSSSFWFSTIITAVAAVNVYMLLAKLCSRYSAETLSFSSGAAAFVAAGHWALVTSGGNYWAAAVVGVTAASIVGGVIAPAFYLVPRGLANVILTPWLAPLLKSVFDGLWAVYAGFWRKFAVVLKVVTAIFGPIIAVFVSVWEGMRAAYARILGRK